jgi:long-subunit acyl-CoA synthetase (AMP-forming)
MLTIKILFSWQCPFKKCAGVPRVWEKIEEKIREAGKTTKGLKRTVADWAKGGAGDDK